MNRTWLVRFVRSGIRRRSGRLILVASMAASVSLMAACGSSNGDNASATKEINLLTWSSYHDEAWLKEYEKRTGVKVNVQLIGSVPEGFAKVKASPDSFDLVLATSGFVENYVDSGLIVPVDESRIPNLSHSVEGLDWRKTTSYKGKNWGVTYTWGTQPLAWVDGRVKTAPQHWDDLWNKEYAGRVSMVDDPTTQLPIIAFALGFEDPYHMTPDQFAQFKTKLKALHGQMTHVSASIQDQTTDFTGGQVDVGVLYNISTFVEANKAGTKLKEIIPSEGAPGWTDNYVITKAGAKKSDLVYDFINATLSVDWMSRLMAVSGNNGNLSLAAAQTPEAQEAGLTTEALNRTELGQAAKDPQFFTKIKLLQRLDNLDEWLAAWNEFKLGLA